MGFRAVGKMPLTAPAGLANPGDRPLTAPAGLPNPDDARICQSELSRWGAGGKTELSWPLTAPAGLPNPDDNGFGFVNPNRAGG